MSNAEVISKLEEIVGKDFASNNQEDLFIYSQDPGVSQPRPVDYVAMPETVEEVQQIVRYANEKKIPIVPMGGGMTLSGLVIPIKGGIVLDMKRMDKIIEINETSRYALIEAGVTSGQLIAHLREKYPDLQTPYPDAPPSVTIAGNALIHGSGYLSQKYGDHGAMINGLEVVLPNGEVCKVGSCAISNYWFTRGPIPDLVGLFTSAFGTMGIVTKISIKLFPKPKLRDIVIGLIKELNTIPGLILNLTKTDIPEDLMIALAEKPDFMKGYAILLLYITGDSQDELDSKTKILKKIYRKNNARFMKLPPRYYDVFLETCVGTIPYFKEISRAFSIA
jgi:glycolate oxidase